MSEPLLKASEIRSCFTSPIPPVRVTLGYRMRLFAVLVGLVALQALYLLLIAVVVTLTCLYSLAVLFSGLPFNFVMIVLYVGPPLAGVITTLFLLKPLLIRPPAPPKPLELTPEDEPLLFEFVNSLCSALGAPRPSRIQVNLQVNAFAAVRGWRGFFLGDVDLTIGL